MSGAQQLQYAVDSPVPVTPRRSLSPWNVAGGNPLPGIAANLLGSPDDLEKARLRAEVASLHEALNATTFQAEEHTSELRSAIIDLSLIHI